MSHTPRRRPCPYRGLAPYREEDAPLFFGRDRDVNRVISNVLASRLTLFYGPSGVGKSSMLYAGVAYRLRAITQADLDDGVAPAHVVVPFGRWSGEPVEELTAAVREALEPLVDGPLPQPDAPGLAAALRAWTAPGGFRGTVVLLLDQFEESFVYKRAVRAGGIADELASLFDPTLEPARAHVLLSFREDALAQLDVFKGRIAGLFDNYLRIGYLTTEQARQAITQPLEHYNTTAEAPVEIEPALVEKVLHDIRAGQVQFEIEGQGGVAEADEDRVETPFLQLVMTRLWEREAQACSGVLRLTTYRATLGGAEAIIRSHLDAALGTLTDAQREAAADVFRYLITPSGTKYAMGAADLARFTGHSPRAVAGLLDALSGAEHRVLRRVPPPRHGEPPRYEVYHDRLGHAVLAWRTRYLADEELARQRRRWRRVAYVIGGPLLVLVLASAAFGIYKYSVAVYANNEIISRGIENRIDVKFNDSLNVELQYVINDSLDINTNQKNVIENLNNEIDNLRLAIGGNVSNTRNFLYGVDNNNSFYVRRAGGGEEVEVPQSLSSGVQVTKLSPSDEWVGVVRVGGAAAGLYRFPFRGDEWLPLALDQRPSPARRGDVRTLAFSQDAGVVATGGGADEGGLSYGVVHLWRTSDRQLIRPYVYRRPVASISLGASSEPPIALDEDSNAMLPCAYLVFVRATVAPREADRVRARGMAIAAADSLAGRGEAPSLYQFDDRRGRVLSIAAGPYCDREQASAARTTLRRTWDDAYVRDTGGEDWQQRCSTLRLSATTPRPGSSPIPLYACTAAASPRRARPSRPLPRGRASDPQVLQRRSQR